ncbi:MAG: hypothetical protein DHS20C21_05850 [Gemmatimonadota bacterium]|nr:MAG: hypothetical protein DHS20C21_05850 [Gemmatimonadota bacterium]
MNTRHQRIRNMARLGTLPGLAAGLLLLATSGQSTERVRPPVPDPTPSLLTGQDAILTDRSGTGLGQDELPPGRCELGIGQDTVPADWCGTGTGGLHVVVDGQTVQRDFPLKHTRVDAQVSGGVANVVVTQTFTNPYTETIEAVYVFPLPHEAAVSDMTMQLGERTVRGLIERRDEARRIYENARNSGHVAALLEQERPNIFTQSVANILPGSEIEITLVYVETLDYERGVYEFAYPMVVGPRFIPPASQAQLVPAGGEWVSGVPRSGGVRDAERITPPYLPPSIRSGHDIEVNVEWDAGIAIADLTSPTHRVDVEPKKGGRASVRLHPNDRIPNKDLVLRCRVAGDEVQTGVLAYHNGDDGYLTLLLHPKLNLTPGEVTPKEMIFVLDCSGSMSGEPMAAAKSLVRHALRNVNANDTFQIIRFSSQASGLAPAPIAATPENVARGVAYIDQLSGGGGTMMIEGIKASLGFPEDPDRLRMVMFLTDGYIGNEDEILAEIRRSVGSARLFSFGVGSSVNRFLLDRMSEEGRGEVQYFLPGSSIGDEVARFYGRIRNPYLTDVRVEWVGVDVEDALPHRVPDLFDGRPLTVHARYAKGGRGKVRVSGRIAGRAWSEEVTLNLPKRESGNPAVGSLWARARIAGLEKEMVRGEIPDVVEQITELGLRHRLVTKYTSFVAVEERWIVSDGRPKTVRVPLTMPEGVSFEGVFGEVDEVEAQLGSAGGFVGRSRNVPGSPMVSEVKKEARVKASRESALSIGDRDRRENGARQDRASDAPPPRPEESLFSSLGSALRVELRSNPTPARAGAPLELVVTITNDGRTDASIPASLDLDSIRLRVVDSKWNEVLLGSGRQSRALQVLRPGESVTLRLRLTPGEAAFLATPGTYHLTLEAAWLPAGTSRATLRVR